MKVKIIYSVILFTIIAGCSRHIIITPLVGYHQIESRAHINSFKQIDFSKAKDIGLIVNNDFKLSLADSVMQCEDSSLTNYQVFKFTTDFSRQYRINVIAYAFGKMEQAYVFIPQIKVFDGKLRPVEIKRDSSVTVNEYYDKSLHRLAWVFKQSMPNDYYLVVYSDNNNLGRLLDSYDCDFSTGYAHYHYHVLINSTLFGEFRIRIENL